LSAAVVVVDLRIATIPRRLHSLTYFKVKFTILHRACRYCIASEAVTHNCKNVTIEINMHHLRGNAIPAGRVQYPLSDCDEILCR